MRLPRSSLLLFLVLLFSLNIAGASWLAFTGSDRQPFESKIDPQCARPSINLITDETKKSKKVVAISLAGDFRRCAGAQLLVSIHKDGKSHAYAVKEINGTETTILLNFERDDVIRDFRRDFPDVLEGRLVPTGPYVPPMTQLQTADVELIFAWQWVG